MEPLGDVRCDRPERCVARHLGRRRDLPGQPREKVRVFPFQQLLERGAPPRVERRGVPRGPTPEEQVELEEAALPGAVEERVDVRPAVGVAEVEVVLVVVRFVVGGRG